ncbi:MAG TPA: RIP metalloprotease RseP [Burkholderiales bacterium]|nr:RIP metalloprotease RseP [Burkholderiales bacterium]
MSLLHTIVAFVVALGVLIVVHEYGHYLAARLCNIKVLRFSVGFGKPIATWRRGRDGTEWTIAAVPFGGYVKMLDEREGFVSAEDLPRAFNRQSVWKRFAVVVAGPVFNFVFAVLVYAMLFMHGLPEVRPIIAQPAVGTPAAQAGFRAGETLRAIDGKPVRTWGEVRWRVLEAALQHEVLSIEAIDQRQQISVLTLDLSHVTDKEVESDLLAHLGLQLYRPTLEPVLGRLVAGSPAERAGLAPGDRIARVDGAPVETWEGLVRAIRAHPEQTLRLAVVRNGTTLSLEVRPEAVEANGERFGRIGAAPRIPPSHADRMLVRVHYGPIESLLKAAGKTYDIAVFSLRMIGKMLLGEVSWRHLSGPVTIADFAGQSAQMGWIPYVNFLALISISLGVLNLLPIPLLDGGHLMYYTVEIIKGSPVSDRAMELGQRVGLTLLLVMMAFAFYNDLNRLLSG